jgi:hypothetical protein
LILGGSIPPAQFFKKNSGKTKKIRKKSFFAQKKFPKKIAIDFYMMPQCIVSAFQGKE